MPIGLSERAIGALIDLGLTGTEIKAYLALLKGGSMTASDVSRSSGIPYSKVYDALESLKKKGWVDQQRGRPIVYTPRPPDVAIEELRLRCETERKEKEKIALQELMGIYENRGEQEKPDVWIMRGNNEIVSRVKNLIINCKNELLIALPPYLAEFAGQVIPLLTMLKEKGVRSMILTSPDIPKDVAEQLSKVSELRARKTMYGGGLIADSREVILLLAGGDQQNSPLAIWADHHGLASFARDYFEFLWNSQGTFKV